ncbi:hypothetical protein GW804_00970, partial [Candidatus Falkowbacteria bacterium]|nr:hypothetical protein [Candidatus Falkowbacteria bacterium]
MSGSGNSDPSHGSLSGKTLLIVNSSGANDPLHSKRAFIKKVKSLGLKVIVLSQEANTFQSYVDYCVTANTLNYIEALAVLDNFFKDNADLKLDGVITFL